MHRCSVDQYTRHYGFTHTCVPVSCQISAISSFNGTYYKPNSDVRIGGHGMFKGWKPLVIVASWDYISTIPLPWHKCDLRHKGHAASWGHVPGWIRCINPRTTCKVPISIGTLNNQQCDILRVHGQYCGTPISENRCVKRRNIGIYTTDG